jgi:lipopolysaccharide biosynthesis protein
MKVSELIKELQCMQEAYGDLIVNMTYGHAEWHHRDENMFLVYDQMKDRDEISIRNFSY